MQPLRLDDLTFLNQKLFMLIKLGAYRFNSAFDHRFGHHIVGFRVNRDTCFVLYDHFAQKRVNRVNCLDLVTPKFDPIRLVLIARVKLDDITPDAKRAAFEIDIDTLILQFDELLQKFLSLDFHARLDKNQHSKIRVRVTETVDTRHRRHDDHVAPLKKRARRREPQTINLLVDGRFFFYVKIGGRNVGLGLVIVVIRDKILDRVLGEKSLEFLIKLCRERLVMRQHECRPLRLFDHMGNRKCLAAARYAQQNLIFRAVVQIIDELFDCFGLIALRRIFRNETELHPLIIAKECRKIKRR